MLHVYTHVVTRSIAAEIVDFPQVPFALPNDSWLIQAQAVLPKRPTHVLAADPTLLDFPPRDDHPWPALTTIRWKDRANAINTAGGASSVANRNDNHAAIITAVLCFTMLLAALIVVAWVQHRRRRSASSVSRVKMLGSELTEEVVKEALGHGVRMLVRIPPPPDFSSAHFQLPGYERRPAHVPTTIAAHIACSIRRGYPMHARRAHSAHSDIPRSELHPRFKLGGPELVHTIHVHGRSTTMLPRCSLCNTSFRDTYS